jgi:hypothetical protein
MELTGNIKKMRSTLGKEVQYQLPLGEQTIEMNQLIDRQIEMEYQGKIHCIRCGRETKKSFAQGYCYPCFTTAPETEECVLRPELCRAHEGIARDMEYANSHCLIEHVVYLSLTSGLKVGVTRNTQVPTRWIDQGATEAIELARTPNRFLAGLMEVALKAHINDKTNWRKMLAGYLEESVELAGEKLRLATLIPEDLQRFVIQENRIIKISYPVRKYPEKVRSVNFDKDPLVSGTLSGIKGQYLIFQDNSVMNMRKFGGYLVQFRTSD